MLSCKQLGQEQTHLTIRIQVLMTKQIDLELTHHKLSEYNLDYDQNNKSNHLKLTLETSLLDKEY